MFIHQWINPGIGWSILSGVKWSWTPAFPVRMGNDLYLIQIEGLDEATKRQEEIDYIVFKTVLRNALSELTIELKYSDIYEKNFYTEVRKLDWFARTLKE